MSLTVAPLMGCSPPMARPVAPTEVVLVEETEVEIPMPQPTKARDRRATAAIGILSLIMLSTLGPRNAKSGCHSAEVVPGDYELGSFS